MKPRKKLRRAIIFFGPDGAGKTTQADLLDRELRMRNIKVKKIWIRSLHTLAFIISKVAMRILKLNSVYEFRSKHVRSKSLWYVVEFVSILPLILTRFYLPLSQGYIVIAERFVIDWIVALAYAKHDDSLLTSRWSKIILHFIPKDSILIYIDADYETISSRRPGEDAFEFIQFQRTWYDIFAKNLRAFKINTTNMSIDEVNRLILCTCNIEERPEEV